jgi:hypothetical protein
MYQWNRKVVEALNWLAQTSQCFFRLSKQHDAFSGEGAGSLGQQPY